jgi:hypothetical protein
MKKIKKFRKNLEDSGASSNLKSRGKKKKKSLRNDIGFDEKKPKKYYYEEE